MRKLLIVGNWKMNKTASEAGPFVQRLSELVSSSEGVDVVLAPPFTAIQAVRDAMAETRPFALAAQNLFWENQGPYTGEVSASMVRDLGCTYAILGHSERRHHVGERDEDIHRKVRTALRHDLAPILCLGETLAEREAEKTESVLSRQLTQGLEGLSRDEVRRITIAYEPIWAIGTGRPASLSQVETVHELLHRILVDHWGTEAVAPVRLLYGGSVTPANTGDLLKSTLIDGALVGNACLDAQAFAKIIGTAQEVVSR
ncbi:MAG: triose-phosphate isomerase [candidate division NC10 bacterium]